jgi:hypothetical protein
MELRNGDRTETMTSISPADGEILTSNNFFKPLTEHHKPVFSASNETEIAFTGIGSILDHENQFVFPILRAKKNTYSRTQYTEDPDNPAKVSDAQGEQLVVVAGY